MKRSTLVLVALLLLVGGCGVFKKVPQPNNETKVTYVYKDSTVVKEVVKEVDLPVERIVDAVAVYDTLELETSLAKARAYVDTTSHTLKGSIENKKTANLKIEYRDRFIYRDSIYTKEVPVPYEVEKEVVKYPVLFWVLLVFAITVLGMKFPKLIKAANWLTKFDWKKLLFWKKKTKK